MDYGMDPNVVDAPQWSGQLQEALTDLPSFSIVMNLDDLFVKTAFADMAPNQHMRRWRPRAQGRATRVVKGMSHITVVVSDGEES